MYVYLFGYWLCCIDFAKNVELTLKIFAWSSKRNVMARKLVDEYLV